MYSKYLDEIIILDEAQKEKLKKYYEILVEFSKRMNLTTITKIEEVYIKHFYDSILTLKNAQISKDSSLLDVGSGAGFPGLVLKICFPDLKVVLLEPTKKRCDFLNYVINALDLKKIEVVNDRAENYILNCKESFDFVTARAVARLNILSELTLGFVKLNGYFISLKAVDVLDELEEAKNAINKMGGVLQNIFEYSLPQDMGKRFIIYIQKHKKTPSIYPRSFAKIKKNPL